MDKEHAQLIIKLIEEQDNKRDLQISGVQKNLDAGFDLLAKEMNKISEQKAIQNGRVDKLENITRVNKFIVNNPRISILVLIVFYFGVPKVLSLIPLVELIKKMI